MKFSIHLRPLLRKPTGSYLARQCSGSSSSEQIEFQPCDHTSLAECGSCGHRLGCLQCPRAGTLAGVEYGSFGECDIGCVVGLVLSFVWHLCDCGGGFFDVFEGVELVSVCDLVAFGGFATGWVFRGSNTSHCGSVR